MDTIALCPGPLAVGTLLERVADEIASLARLAREMPVPVGLADDEAVVAAQSQDLLEQTLDDLASFLRVGAGSIGGSVEADMGPALGTLRLSALAARLSGARPQAEAAGGDLDLF